MKRVYNIWVCPSCEDNHQYAGFCPDCNDRLVSARCVPVESIEEFRDEMASRSSPVPAWFINDFVASLKRWATP